MRSTVTLGDDTLFTGDVGGFHIPIGDAPEDGGERKGMSPKMLTLTSLAGCTAIDVIHMLRKMRIDPEHFSVDAEGDLCEEYPRVFTKIVVTYRVRGGGVTREKVERAVALSQDKYCGVSAMLRKAAPIETRVIIEE